MRDERAKSKWELRKADNPIGPAAMWPRQRAGHKPATDMQSKPKTHLTRRGRPDEAIKHITAYDPVAKWTAARVMRYLKASGPKALLDKIIETAPSKISGIQVDGGSEFKSIFEEQCQRRGLELLVLPFKRPDLNGCVERAQSTWRYEFYAVYDLPHKIEKLQACVDAFAHHFNSQRPHDALAGLTPAEYLKNLAASAA
jgi:hypothetical protein